MASINELKRWAVGLRRRHQDVPARDIVAAVVDRVGAALEAGPLAAGSDTALLDDVVDPPRGWANPWLVGAVHEQVASAADRKARGAWYTPRPVVEGLVRIAIVDGADDGRAPNLIVDPTCGGGAFLLAALDRLIDLDVEPLAAFERVVGMDLDPTAVEVSRWSMQLWLSQRLGWRRAEPHLHRADVRCGDALTDLPPAWTGRVAVVGNPPFASPLRSGAVRQSAAAYRDARLHLLGPYADLAAIHLLHAIEGLEEGSTVVLVQPQSILSSRDTEGLRSWLDEFAPLQALWASRQALFDAGVRPCAPILRVGASPVGDVALYHGATVDVRSRRPRRPGLRWGSFAADALGAPELPSLDGAGRLGSLIAATAGFRDEHYALVAACREGTSEVSALHSDADSGIGRVLTVGSVDPLTAAWGRKPFRFGGRTWTHPVVDRNDLPPRVQRWFDRLRRPKVLLATQAKLLEPYVDRQGTVVPTTPLIAVTADPADLDRVAAVMLAPPVVLWAWRRWFGTALSVDAVKLAAKQVGELPLPADAELWDRAAALVAASDALEPSAAWDRTVEVAELMNDAYGADQDVFRWWRSRLKPRPELAGTSHPPLAGERRLPEQLVIAFGSSAEPSAPDASAVRPGVEG